MSQNLGWGSTRCALDLSLVTGNHFVCVCSAIGSVDLVVVEKHVSFPKKAVLFSFRSINWSDIMHYFSWGTFKKYPQVFLTVFALDLIWIALVIRAKCVGNETTVSKRKGGKDDSYWSWYRSQTRKKKRQQEARSRVTLSSRIDPERDRRRCSQRLRLRLRKRFRRVYNAFWYRFKPWLAKKLHWKWLRTTGYQIRRQHKLIRSCYAKYTIDEDPCKFHTGYAPRARARHRSGHRP